MSEISVDLGKLLGEYLERQVAGPAPPPPPPPAVVVEKYGEWQTQRVADDLRLAANELRNRQCEALRLYRPTPPQEQFHRSRVRQRVVRGSNRSGKTLAAVVEVARCVTGQDPYGKFPPLGDGLDRTAWLVGLDLMHCASVFYKKLFRPGELRMLWDDRLGRFRAYDPLDPWDVERKAQTKPCPALIPKRLVESVAWEDKAKGIPRLVKLKTGWTLMFHSSLSSPPQGMPVDLALFDEEIENEDWFPETIVRLASRGGSFIWSATPQAGCEQLLELSEKAERDAGREDRLVEEFVILLAENPHIAQADKKMMAEMLSEEQARVRIDGEFAAHGLRVFPEFSVHTHTRATEIKAHWSRYAAVDPGRQVCAVLFVACPPPGEEEFDAIVYDELYIRGASAASFGEQMALKCSGQEFEAFVIDWHMARQGEIGSGFTVEAQYSKALKVNGVSARRTGHSFAWGMDDPRAGCELVRGWLRPDSNTGAPRLAVLRDAVPNFLREIKKYRFKRAGKVVTDEPESRGDVHLMACLRYLVGYPVKYTRSARAKKADGALAVLERKRNKKRAGGPRSVNLGPPGGG